MPWSGLQRFPRRIATPLRRLIAGYALLLALFTLLRFLRVAGFPLIDLANAFAPYWYMPLVLTFPLSILVARGSGQPPDGDSRKKRDNEDRAGLPPPRWSVPLQIALIAAGLLAFAWKAVYAPVNPPTGEVFSVVTFNVQGSNRELERATEWLLERGPDVIALQETAEGDDGRLARLYDSYAHEARVAGGLRVLSRFAITEREVLTIEDAPGKLALRLRLDLAGRELAVYALHFTLPLKPRAQYEPDADIGLEALLRYDEARRNAQIRRFLERIQGEESAYVVAGDFNMSDSSLIYAEIAAVMQDAWRGAGNGAGRTWPVAEAIGLPRVIHPMLRIDYLWHSEALRTATASVGPAIGSDHLPLLAEFEWRDAAD